ncbi:hypothetical protein F4679DRAFT_577490 [Xylaria curta]|nr:hypothetical protein F4679DRAFT_577490 [Xylaria curta]
MSREWQIIIERHNFARIKLTPSRLAGFEPKEYDYAECAPRDPDAWGVSDNDNILITTAFKDMLLAIIAWELEGEPNGDLLLDISVHSPSDSKHWFKYLTLEHDTPLHMSNQIPRHGWVAGNQNSILTNMAIYKVFEELLRDGPFEDDKGEKEWWQQLPAVSAVTNHSTLSYKKLRKLFIFENFNQEYPSSFDDCAPIRNPTVAISRTIVTASLGLEHLSASFIVDAAHFLHAIKSPTYDYCSEWPYLISLVLTLQLLMPMEDSTTVNGMWQEASTGDRGRPIIIWRGTWEFDLQLSTIRAWEAVAHKHDGEDPAVVTELLDSGTVESHGDAIHHLKLSKPVIRPISLQQIRMEHNIPK